MAQEARIPEVGDTVIVSGTPFEIRAIIAEDDNLILREAAADPKSSDVWVLSQAKLVWLQGRVWRASGYRSFERGEEPGKGGGR